MGSEGKTVIGFGKQMKTGIKKHAVACFFVAPQVGLEPKTLRLTADESITTSIVIDNSQTELVIRSVSTTRIVPPQPFIV